MIRHFAVPCLALLLDCPHLLAGVGRAPVEMDILPLATNPLPHTRLFCRYCQWAAAAVDLLLEAHIAHHSSIFTQQPHLQQQKVVGSQLN